LACLLLISEIAFGDLLGVGSGAFSDAAAAHKDLGLQDKLILARFTLHVIDGVTLLDVGIETENHADSVRLAKGN